MPSNNYCHRDKFSIKSDFHANIYTLNYKMTLLTINDIQGSIGAAGAKGISGEAGKQVGNEKI